MSVDMIARGMAAAAAKGGGGGGTSVQSDWTQNDATAADYVKNRPGAYDAVQEIKITEGIFTDQDSEGGQFEVPASAVKVGQQFLVTIEGETTTYTASAVTDAEGVVQFGTFKYEDAETPPENGYIFLLNPDPSLFGIGVGLGTYICKAFTLSYTETTTHKIAEKYLDLTNTGAQITVAQETATNAQTAATDAATQVTAIKKDYDPNLSPLWSVGGVGFNKYYVNMKSEGEGRIVDISGNTSVKLTEAGQGYGLPWSRYDINTQYTYYYQPIYGQEYTIDDDTFVWDAKSMGDDDSGKLSFDVKTGLYSWTKSSWASPMTIKGSFAVSPSNKHKETDRKSGQEELVFASPTMPPYVATPALLMISSTADSTKLFRVTVDDSGALTATEVDM